MFDLLLFGPGLPGQGQKAQAFFVGDSLEVDLGDGWRQTIACASLTVGAGGFNDQQLILEWSSSDGKWSAVSADISAKQAFLKLAPAILAPQLVRWQAKTRAVQRRFRLGSWALGVIVALPFLLVGVLIWQAPQITGWVANKIPPELEGDLGRMSTAQIKASGGLIEEGELVDLVTAIGGRLTQGSHYKYHWYVLKNDTINAFAMPGGYVVVHTGLLKSASSAEELAGVLAHEVQHVELRHRLRQLLNQLGWQVVLTLAVGGADGTVWAGATQQLMQLSFGREQESQADVAGLAALRRANISPQGMLDFFEKLSKQEGVSIELLSTHPASANRLDVLRKAVQEGSAAPAPALPYDWSKIKLAIETAVK